MNGYKIIDTKFEENAILSIAVKNELKEKFEKEISDITDRKAKIRILVEQFYS